MQHTPHDHFAAAGPETKERNAMTEHEKMKHGYLWRADEENIALQTRCKELVKQFKIFQAPTLVVVGDNGVEKYAGAPKVIEYINSRVLV